MECMTLAEIFATTIFFVKLMHDCTLSKIISLVRLCTWHIVHDHVQVSLVLEGKVELDDPLGVGMGHDVPLFPEKR